MIKDSLQRTDKTLAERGLPQGSYFELTFSDGSSITEHEVNWSSISEESRVAYAGYTKTVFLCTQPVSRITMNHDGLTSALDVPSGCQAYQAVRSFATMRIGETSHGEVVGRVIGIVQNGAIVEEHFINGKEGVVRGVKL